MTDPPRKTTEPPPVTPTSTSPPAYRDFVDAEAELAVWIDDRAWTTGEGAVAVVNGAVGWLRGRQVLLPRVMTLARLVARERDAATLRVWTELAQSVSGGQTRLLRGLLVVSDGSRRSELDRMRTAETVTSGAGMVRARRRVSDVAGLRLGGLDLSVVPPSTGGLSGALRHGGEGDGVASSP